MFSEQERRIFRFHDGKQEVHADPLAVQRRFYQALDGDPHSVLQAAQEPREGKVEEEAPAARLARMQAQERLVEAARVAFPMQPFDPATGEGATEEHCLAALYAWLAWLEGVKKKAAS